MDSIAWEGMKLKSMRSVPQTIEKAPLVGAHQMMLRCGKYHLPLISPSSGGKELAPCQPQAGCCSVIGPVPRLLLIRASLGTYYARGGPSRQVKTTAPKSPCRSTPQARVFVIESLTSTITYPAPLGTGSGTMIWRPDWAASVKDVRPLFARARRPGVGTCRPLSCSRSVLEGPSPT